MNKNRQRLATPRKVFESFNVPHSQIHCEVCQVVYLEDSLFSKWAKLNSCEAPFLNLTPIENWGEIDCLSHREIIAMSHVDAAGMPNSPLKFGDHEILHEHHNLRCILYTEIYCLDCEIAAIENGARGYWAFNQGAAECLIALQSVRNSKSYFTNHAISMTVFHKTV